MKPPKKAARLVLFLLALTFIAFVLIGLLTGCGEPPQMSYQIPVKASVKWVPHYSGGNGWLAFAFLHRLQKGQPKIELTIICYRNRAVPWRDIRKHRDWVKNHQPDPPRTYSSRLGLIEASYDESAGTMVVRSQDTQSWYGRGRQPTTYLWAVKNVGPEKAAAVVKARWPSSMGGDVLEEHLSVFRSVTCR